MKKTSFFIFLNRVLYSSFFLWLLLAFLKMFNLKMEIKISFFFLLFIFLFLIIYHRKILFLSTLFLNKINFVLKTSKKLKFTESRSVSYLFYFFIREFLKFLKGFHLFLKLILTNYFFWLMLSILGVLLDTFVLKSTFDLLILFLAGLWILSAYHFKFKARNSISLALFFLILCPFLLISKKELIVEKAAIWAYIFLVVGVAQIIIDNIKEKKNIR